ncbi:hypothetical protein [Ruminococcus sp.]|uniref:hypothetical protein n=1 Tax=Ruminococcus sp. TaxID=41978 RepID=UPI0025D89034|nr:hypothetical protein [Ruminococcus sp.]
MKVDTFINAVGMIDERHLKIDIHEENAPHTDIIMSRKTDRHYDDNEPEITVSGVDVCHRFTWRKTLAVAMSLAIFAGAAVTGRLFYAQIKNTNQFTNDTEYSSIEKAFKPIAITNDYEGPILGVENWHIEQKSYASETVNKYFQVYNYFIDDDTGRTFAFYISAGESQSAYLTDLDNDGNPELICNSVYGELIRILCNNTKIYRLNNDIIECGICTDNQETFIQGTDISNTPILSNCYDPLKNEIILTNKRTDEKFELGIDDFTFNPADCISFYGNSPIKVNSSYKGSILGIKNWHIEKKSDKNYTHILFINDDTKEVFASYRTLDYAYDKSAYLADLNGDGILELICNNIYLNDSGNTEKNVEVFRLKKGIIEKGELLEEKSLNSYYVTSIGSKYEPDTKKIILQIGSGIYEMDNAFFIFKSEEINNVNAAEK